jgi:Delta7-sterol 5-desaturase
LQQIGQPCRFFGEKKTPPISTISALRSLAHTVRALTLERQASMTFSELLPTLPGAAVGILMADFLRYFVAAALVYGLVWKLFGTALAGRRITSQDPKPGQMGREFGHSMVTVLLFAGSGLFIYSMFKLGLTQIYTDLAQYGWAWWWASLGLMMVAHDTWFYWTHRLLHRPWWFARFHSVHHQSVQPTPWAAYSFHPVEALIQTLFYVIMVHTLPMHDGMLFVFLTWMILRNTLGHSGYELMPWQATAHGPLRWLLTNSHHHDHHAAGRGNFGLYFTWWDRAMGTEDRSYIDNGDWRFLGASSPLGQKILNKSE